MAQKCSNCNTINQGEEKFCNNCGMDLTKTLNTPYAGMRQPSPDGKSDILGNPLLTLPQGTILKGKYIIKYHTAGGMGAIYLAREINTQEEFVIKEAYSISPKKREEFIIALTKERETLIRLNHPGIVKVLDFFEEHDAYYLVMEYIRGQSLEEYEESITLEQIDENMVINRGIELCEILSYLHNLNPPIIYRDLKPNNILIKEEDNLKLIDFGIARVFKQEASKDTIPFGTRGFAAPEQYGNKQTDIRSDIYSLGATLHYLLTKKDPGESPNPFIFLPVKEINPAISLELSNIISRALEVDQEKRYSSAKEMGEMLKKLLPVISIKPGFIKIKAIEYGIKEKIELKIANKGKGELTGSIALPDSFPGISANMINFKGDETIEIEIDTSLLNTGENYCDNIVIFSSGGNVYIPLSFSICEKKSREELMPIKKQEKELKTNIINLPSEPAQNTKKNKNKNYWIGIGISAILGTCFMFLIFINCIYKHFCTDSLKKESLQHLIGCKLCFVSEGEPYNGGVNYDIFSVYPDGRELKNLTNNIAWDCFPAYAPLENKIAFSSNRNKLYKIYIMNDDGSNSIRLTRESLDATCPSWSPDNEKIAFQAFFEDNYEIFCIKSDGTRLINLTENKSGDFNPSWSPDGKYIAFESKRDNKKDKDGILTREIYIMKSNGDNPIRLTNNSYDDFSPSWSHDSSKIVFISNINENYDIFTINRDGSNLYRVTESIEQENYPLWSPDGKKIIYSCYKGNTWQKLMGIKNKWELYAINPDGTKPVKLLDFGGKQMSLKLVNSLREQKKEIPQIEVIKKNFKAIAEKNYKVAYELRSEKAQSINSYNDFYNNWKNNKKIKIEKINTIEITKDKAILEVIVSSSDSTVDGKIFTGKYRGIYHLILEKNLWKIDASKVKLMEE
ncbi:MAG TPA: protein kinase [Candidatus Eremiobacteraeota bacterium]|mgnify:CR=1 FL=1|nr:MAG: Serine/threonine-protein kinase PrkC [bacterium ADurb.Bin363]HPZ08265.1 protein kinase [Candidatus Eremiobacteraeota bacterium]